MNRILVNCKFCGTPCFPARYRGRPIVVDWYQPIAGRWLLVETASGTATVKDLGQEMVGGFNVHGCPKMVARAKAFQPRRPQR